jgi:hypothetical protein
MATDARAMAAPRHQTLLIFIDEFMPPPLGALMAVDWALGAVMAVDWA